MEKSCQAVLPPCMFVSILHRHTATVGGRGSFYYQLETNHSEESFTGIHHFTSTLLTKPFGYFCAMFQRVLGSCGCPFLAAPRATKHPTGCRGAEQRFEPTQGSQGLTHCARQPSQRLLASHRAEPANGRGDVSTSHHRNEAATPAPAEAGAWDEQWQRCALLRIKLFRGSQVPVCHGDGRVINGFGRTTVRWL